MALEGACNARDVGGLPTVDGRTTRHGVLLRADNLQDLTPEDVAALQAAGVRTVLDLRTSYEVEATGPGPLRGTEVRHLHLDLVPDGLEGREQLVDRALPTEGAGEHAMDHHYLDYLTDAPGAVADALRAVADPRNGA
ncbi:MAG: tyrosine-protein phosphatase, partial [Mycobacteriales bacterium]